MRKATYSALLLTSAAAVAMPASAFAQDVAGTPDDAATQDQATESTGMSEIIVTAQKRSENLQKVPISISVATSDQLEISGASSVMDIKMALPGVDIQRNTGYALPVIRGIAFKGVTAGLEPSVAFYVDDVYIAAQTSTMFSLSNILQIEALKGPQGTLFGRNATAGLVHVRTRDPSDVLSGDLKLSYGNYDTFHTSGYLAGPLSDTVSADIAATFTTMGDGYGKNLLNGRDVYRTNHDFGIRSKWVFEPTSATKVRLIFDYSDQKSSNNAARVPIGDTAPAPYGPVYGGGPWDVSATQPLTRFKGGGVSMRVDQELGPVDFASITAYRESKTGVNFDVDYTPADGREINFLQEDWQFSQELQLSSAKGSSVQWLAGAYFFKASSGYHPFDFYFRGPAIPPAGPVAGLNHVNIEDDHKTSSLSAFGQVTVPLTATLKITGGLRYTNERRSLVDALETRYFSNGNAVLLPYPDASLKFGKVTWRLALDYQVSDDTLVYASYNRGFKSGGFNAGAPLISPFLPETLDSYEAGLKTSFLDRRGRLNFAAFYYDFADLQVQRNVNGQTGIYNSGPAKQYGFEGELELQPVDGLTLRANYQYIPTAEYKDFPNAVIASPRAAGGFNLGVGSATGNRLALSPKHTFGLGAAYSVAVGDGDLGLNLSYYYNGGYYHEPDNVTKQGSYNILNANIRYELESGFSASVWANNLTNAVAANIDGLQSFGATGIRRASYQAPRTYGVTIGYSF